MEHFMIKDATKKLDIEAHVLRYWEEELGIDIKRNSMGHRYYDEKDIKLFEEIKRLRNDGVPLKQIKESIDRARKVRTEHEKEEEHKCGENQNEDKTDGLVACDKKEIIEEENSNIVDFKYAQMQTIMNKIVACAFKENKSVITNAIRSEVTTDVMRQMDVLLKEREEREEERFRKLDECMRQIQRVNEEVAATRTRKIFGRKRH